MKQVVVAFPGGVIVEDAINKCVLILYKEKPGREMQEKLNKSGFRWSRPCKAWKRHGSQEALEAAKRVCGV